jgi:mannose/fructose/N-acetylgalactosamine-specific phosphotransferase system component IIC
MWFDLMMISVWGGFAALDTTAAFQIMSARPLVSCSIIGFLLGDFSLGFILGTLLELLWLNELPIGGAFLAEGNLGAVVTASVGILAAHQTGRNELSLALALITGTFISLTSGYLVVWMRRINSKLYERLLFRKKLSFKHISRTHWAGIGFNFIIGVFLTGILAYILGLQGFPPIIRAIPPEWDVYARPIGSAFLGIGCATLWTLFVNRKQWLWLIVGLAGGASAFALTL